MYVLHFTGKTSISGSSETPNNIITNQNLDSLATRDIAYVDIDSLLLHYRLSEDLNDAFLIKQQNLKAEVENNTTKFQQDYEAFVKKVQRGGFLTQQRAAEEEQRLAERQQELQNLQYDLSNRLMQEQQKMTLELYDSIVSFVREYNRKLNYTYILGNSEGGGLLYANGNLNITADILKGLNERYLKGKENK